jgi:hypothetical protein
MQDEYIEGFTDALDSVPIVSAEYAALEKERDELKKALQLIYSLTDSGMRDGDEAREIAKRALFSDSALGKGEGL